MTKQMFDPSKFDNASAPVQPKPELPGFTFSPQNFKDHRRSLEAERQAELNDLRRAPLGPIKRGSFSALSVFEKCRYATYLSKVVHAPDPAGPAAERGNVIHLDIENYIQGIGDTLCKEASKHYHELITLLREQYAEGKVEVEGEWAFDRDWQVVDWDAEEAWMRIKLDAIHHESPTSAKVHDWKSGRKFGNEMKHAQQLQLYAIGTFLRYTELDFVHGEMNYVDKNDKLPSEYTREEAMEFLDRWTIRNLRMTTATEFPATPSQGNCQWCPHAKVQDGHHTPICDFRYRG